MSKKLYAALDIGTSKVKIGIYNVESARIEIIASDLSPVCLETDLAFVDWADLIEIINKQLLSLAAYCSETGIEDLQLGLCGQVSSLLPWQVQQHGPVENEIPIWLDRRCADSLEAVGNVLSASRAAQELGTCLPLACNWLLVKLHHYLQAHSSEGIKFLQLHDAVFYLLSGRCASHPSSQVSVVHNGNLVYASELLHDLGLSPNHFPQLDAASYAAPITVEARERYQLPATQVYVGMADMYAGFNGFHLKQGELLWQCNTSEIFGYYGESDTGNTLPRQRMDGQWLQYGSTTSGAYNINWFMQRVTPNSSIDEMTQLAQAVPAGSDGLIYLPFLAGERAPHWDDQLSSCFIGLRQQHGPAHMFRAILEGVAFNKRHILESFPETAATCKIAGGSSVNHLWNQIRSDIIQKPLQRMQETEIALLGVLRFIAGVNGDQFMLSVLKQKAFGECIQPNPQTQPVYDRYYQMYRRCQESLSSIMHQLRVPEPAACETVHV